MSLEQLLALITLGFVDLYTAESDVAAARRSARMTLLVTDRPNRTLTAAVTAFS